MSKRKIPPRMPGKRLSLKEKTDRMMGALIKNLNANVLKDNPEPSNTTEDLNNGESINEY
jgi:hypothetical protein